MVWCETNRIFWAAGFYQDCGDGKKSEFLSPEFGVRVKDSEQSTSGEMNLEITKAK